MNRWKITICCLGLLVLAVSQAPAEIVTPISVEATSEFAAAENMINGSGLNAIGLHDNNENNMWQTFADPVAGESATFMLESNYDLSAAIIWQYNGLDGFGTPRPDREVDEFEIFVSPTEAGDDFVSLGTFNLDPASDQAAPPGEPAQIFKFAGGDNVRRVTLQINSLQFSEIPGDLGGFSEVRFEGVKVPEPASLAILGLGGMLLMVLRRRRRPT